MNLQRHHPDRSDPPLSDNTATTNAVSSRSLTDSFMEKLNDFTMGEGEEDFSKGSAPDRTNTKSTKWEFENTSFSENIQIDNCRTSIDFDLGVAVDVYEQSNPDALKLRKHMSNVKHHSISKFDDLIRNRLEKMNSAEQMSDEDNMRSKIWIQNFLYTQVLHGFLNKNGPIHGNIFRRLCEQTNIQSNSIYDLYKFTDERATQIVNVITGLKKLLMKKKRLLIAPAVFKLKKLKSESAEEYSVRKLGLRKYHYKRDGEDDALFETMESLLPRIHSEFIKSDTTLTVNNLSLSEVDDLTMVPINDDEEAAVKKLADKIKKKTTMIRLCDHQCPLSNGKVFLAAENHIMKMKSFTDAYTFAQHLVSSNSENMENTDMHFSKFLTMYHGCYSGIRSIETKYKSCLNISTELIKVNEAGCRGTLEDQETCLKLKDLHLTTRNDLHRLLPLNIKRSTQMDAYNKFGTFINNFRTEMSHQETEKCAVCHKLTLDSNLVVWSASKISNYLCEDEKRQAGVKVCIGCRQSIYKDKVPDDSVLNFMTIEQAPECLQNLNWIEKSMIQLLRPVQSVVHLIDNGGRKTDIKGAGGVMVLLPVPIEETVSHLANTLPSCKHLKIVVDAGFTMRIVSVSKMVTALKWLKENNEKYKHVIINEAFEFTENDQILFKKPDTQDKFRKLIAIDETENEAMIQNDDCVIQNLRENEYHGDNLQALQRYTLKKIKYTPQPLSSLNDVETLVFPALFPTGRFGSCHPRTIKIKKSTWLRQRLLNWDRRIAQDSDFLCFQFGLKCQLEMTSAMGTNAQISKNSSGSDVLDGINKGGVGFETKLQTMFKQVRGFPSYWLSVKKELNSHVISFGPPQLLV